MELKCLHIYSCPDFDLKVGDTTGGKEIAEEKKVQMLADYPDWFEKIAAPRAQAGDSGEVGAASFDDKAKRGKVAGAPKSAA